MKQSEIIEQLAIYVKALSERGNTKTVKEINLEIVNWFLDQGIFIGAVPTEE